MDLDMSNEQQDTQDIIVILSKLPEFLRESMMRSRLQDLIACNQETRDEIIDSILTSMGSADINSLTSVIRTWLAIVSGLESKVILAIFEAYLNRIGHDPSLVDSDYLGILFEAFQNLDPNRRDILRYCLIEAMLNHPVGRQIFYRLPKKVLLALLALK